MFHADRNILCVLRRKALAKHAVRSEAENRIQAMISLAKSEVPVMPAELDPGAAHRMEEDRGFGAGRDAGGLRAPGCTFAG